MSSIDEELDQIFDKLLVPLCAQVVSRGYIFLPLRPDASPVEDSWYSVPPDGMPMETISDGKFGQALEANWSRTGLEELKPLGTQLQLVAERLRVRLETSDEISPLVYIMF